MKKLDNRLEHKEVEKNVLKKWKNNKVYEKTLSKDNKYTFFDGPPFATGTPHYGHLLAGTLKDLYPRYKTMMGYSCDRQFGWDCHGLPVEALVQEKLKNVEYDLKYFNQECKKTVFEYSGQWKEPVERFGRWVDMESSYRTLDLEYMNSVWWGFSELYKKGLVYEDFKVMPYSLELRSVLSNFEANQNYKDVVDEALFVKFKCEDFYFLVWTTTPWTLPMNTALALNKDLMYSFVNHENEKFCVESSLVEKVFSKKDYTLESNVSGNLLLEKEYEPLFSYYKENNKFKTYHADFVDNKLGTGVVHVAPGYGEEDFNLGKMYKLPLFLPVDDDGNYGEEVFDFKGLSVLESNKPVTSFLKDKKFLFKRESYKHSYPYCYRTDKKLVYRAVSSWFVKVTELKDDMLKNNEEVNWYPNHVKTGRFYNWVANARDWAVSRNRMFGTPLPLWTNNEGEVYCVSSKEELEKLTGKELKDLHPEFLVDLKLKSKQGNSDLSWVGKVFDCWFESASMPFAKLGYPYKRGSVDKFKENFPADFVCEGLDQTRGWFYTMLVVSTGLFNKSPFKNVLVNGLVLAEDGKKMSKMLKNYPDPRVLLDKYGADSVRLYLLSSAATQAESFKFKESGVKDFYKELLKLHNVLSFFLNYANLDKYRPEKKHYKPKEKLNRWLLSRLQETTNDVHYYLKEFNSQESVKCLMKFLEDMSNTYVRLKRKTFQSSTMSLLKKESYDTFYFVLLEYSKLLAPFAPFYSDYLYNNLEGDLLSVHLDNYPAYNEQLLDKRLNKAFEVFQEACSLSRNFREGLDFSNKVPLPSVTLLLDGEELEKDLMDLKEFFKQEFNSKKVLFSHKERDFVKYGFKVNYKEVGSVLKKDVNNFNKYLNNLNERDLELFKSKRFLKYKEFLFDEKSVLLIKESKNLSDVVVGDSLSLLFDTKVDDELRKEGLFKEMLRELQSLRKRLNLPFDAYLEVSFFTKNEETSLLKKYENKLKKELLVKKLYFYKDLGEREEKVSGKNFEFLVQVIKL